MVIQHNLSAMNSHRQMGVNKSSTSGNLEKLSSGYRINKAGDDAAGLAISEKMRGQIRGLDMAATNTENGISLIQTAEGGLNETHSVLQRMRELAVQSSNGTYHDDVDRENIDKEVQSLKDEINRIASSTHYNGIKLLDGSMGGESVKSLLAADPTGASVNQMFVDLGFLSGSESLVLAGGYEDTYRGQEAMLIVREGANGSSATVSLQIGDKTYSLATADGVAASGGLLSTDTTFFSIDDDGNYCVVAFLTASFNDANVKNSGVVKGTFGEFDFFSFYNDDIIVTTDKSKLMFQIGANGAADQRVGLHIDNMSCAFLGSSSKDPTAPDVLRGFKVIDIAVDTQDKAKASIRILDDAINQVSGTRAALGALQNRLEHTLNNLGTTRENLQAAESSIRDADMAKEMMEFTKNNILVQASQSMLAQANQLPQGVLQLLR